MNTDAQDIVRHAVRTVLIVLLASGCARGAPPRAQSSTVSPRPVGDAGVDPESTGDASTLPPLAEAPRIDPENPYADPREVAEARARDAEMDRIAASFDACMRAADELPTMPCINDGDCARQVRRRMPKDCDAPVLRCGLDARDNRSCLSDCDPPWFTLRDGKKYYKKRCLEQMPRTRMPTSR